MFTVPSGVTGVTISSIVFCNQSKVSPAQVRVSVAVSGAPDDPSQYLFYDTILQPRETRAAVVGVTMGTGDVLRVQSDTGFVSFSAFGVQVLP